MLIKTLVLIESEVFMKRSEHISWKLFNKWGRLLIDDKMCTTYFPIDSDFTCICQGRLQFLVKHSPAAETNELPIQSSYRFAFYRRLARLYHCSVTLPLTTQMKKSLHTQGICRAGGFYHNTIENCASLLD